MEFIPPSKKYSADNNSALEEITTSIVEPLLQHCQSGKAGLVLVLYSGRLPEAIYRKALEKAQSSGYQVEEIHFSELGSDPVKTLLSSRPKNTPRLAFVHFPRQPQLDKSFLKALNALNMQRGVFFNECLCAVFWVNEQSMRHLVEHASNFIDFRIRFIEIEGEPEKEAPVSKTLHNLPYLPSPLFFGRAKEMQEISSLLSHNQATAITQTLAFEGLGGVGKTRLAIEYAWKNLDQYKAALFVCADSELSLKINIGELTGILKLPQAGSINAEEKFEATLHWLENNSPWLLILDGADSEEASEAIKNLLPRLKGGHLLITSRFRRWPDAFRPIQLDLFSEDQAAEFLFKATKGRIPEQPLDERDARTAAQTLSSSLGYLPLALAMSASYIREKQITISEYVKHFEEMRKAVLIKPKIWRQHDYPLSIEVTFLRSFSELSAHAQTLLRLASWFAAEPISEEIFVKGNQTLHTAFKQNGIDVPIDFNFSSIIDELYSFSLAQKEENNSFSVHRLVQEVVRENLKDEEKEQYLNWDFEILNSYLPEIIPSDVRSWQYWNKSWPHARNVAWEGDKLGLNEPVSDFYNRLGLFFLGKALFKEAEPLMKRALEIAEKFFGHDHPNVATALNNLAQLLQATNRLKEAEPLMKRALEIDQASFGPDHPKVAIRLNNLAQLLQATNRLKEAEPLMKRALEIDEKSFGPDHPDVAIDLNNLAGLLQATNRLKEAEPLMIKVLEIVEKSLGPEHTKVATALNNLAGLLQATNRLQEAEPLMKRALEIDEKAFGPDHPDVARDLNNLALLLQATNRLKEAEPLMKRALEIDEKCFGPEHTKVATALNNLASLLQATNRLQEAEPLMKRALEIDEKAFGPDHPDVAIDLNNLASLLQATNRLQEAEPLMKRALNILIDSYGENHPRIITVRNNLEALEAELKKRVKD